MRKNLFWKNNNNLGQGGSVMIYSILVLASVMTISIALLGIFVPKFKIVRESVRTVAAAFVADSALEWCIFSNRDDPATSPSVPPKPVITSISGITYQIYSGSAVSNCPTGVGGNYRAVGNYGGISRSFEVSLEAAAPAPPSFLVDAGGTLTSSLVAYWKLEEGSGTRADSFGTNNLDPTNNPPSTGGKQGNATQFNVASSQYLSIPDNANLSVGDQDFTIAAWVRLTTKPSQAFIVAHTRNASNERSWNLDYLASVDRLRFVVSSDGTSPGYRWVQADSLGSPSTGQWYLIIAWHDSTANSINIQANNGTINSVSHSLGVHDSTAAWTMGTRGDLSDFWNGLVDEVGFWKRVLTPQERTDLWNGGAGNTIQ